MGLAKMHTLFKQGRPFRAASASAVASALLAVSLAFAGTSALTGCVGSTDTALTSAGSSASAASESSAEEPLTETLFAFDTAITLTAYCDEELMQQAVDRCEYFEEHFSRTIEESDVWNINNAGGESVVVAPETADIIKVGIRYGDETSGLFDITIGAVSSLWDFKEGVRPSDEEIAQAIQHVDYTCVEVDDNTVKLADPEAMIDLGGIAKGYIADDLARIFREGGCESAIINLGGNVYVVGTKPDGSNWRVGIQDPNAPTDAGVIAALDCADESVVTSGLYERMFTMEGTDYYHILDPRTGYPVETDLMSASVAGTSSMDGDVIATWLFLLGNDAALDLVNSRDDIEALLMEKDGTINMSDGAAFVLR